MLTIDPALYVPLLALTALIAFVAAVSLPATQYSDIPRMRWWVAGGLAATASVLVEWASGTPFVINVTLSYAIAVMVLAAFVDSKTRTIPNLYNLLLLLLALGLIVVTAVNFAGTPGWWVGLIWSVAISLVTFVILATASIFGTGFGMGDVKLASSQTLILLLVAISVWPAGALSSVIAPMFLILVVTATFLLAGLFGIAWILIRGIKATRNGFPFGPCLVFAWFIMLPVTVAAGALIPVF